MVSVFTDFLFVELVCLFEALEVVGWDNIIFFDGLPRSLARGWFKAMTSLSSAFS
jgi:hypothetical protein